MNAASRPISLNTGDTMNSEKPAPASMAKLLCTLCALFLVGLGLLAIVSESNSGCARFKGHVTLLGDQAVSMGFVILCMALLPLVVWVPRLWIGWALVAWWLLLMATVFQGIFRPMRAPPLAARRSLVFRLERPATSPA